MNWLRTFKLSIVALTLVAFPFGFILTNSSCQSKPTLRILAADALAHSFRRIQQDFQKAHPEWSIRLETQGSILLGRLAILRPCDVLAVADHRLINRLLTSKHADWVARFASTEMVLVWTERSRYSDEMTSTSWPQVLQRNDVELGLANPDQDPCGYFTLLCWQLAGPQLAAALRAKCPRAKWAFDAAQLLSRLQAFQGDYAFAYRCHATDMHLPHVRLSPEINLGDPKRASHYATVSAKVPNYQGGNETITGAPIQFGITIPRSSRNRTMAKAFIRFCFSETGRQHLEHSSLETISPPLIDAWGPAPSFLDDNEQ